MKTNNNLIPRRFSKRPVCHASLPNGTKRSSRKILKEYKRNQQVDVTGMLLRTFNLNEKQQKVAKDLQTKKPLPLEKAKQSIREGRL